jgi:hypothetical protein
MSFTNDQIEALVYAASLAADHIHDKKIANSCRLAIAPFVNKSKRLTKDEVLKTLWNVAYMNTEASAACRDDCVQGWELQLRSLFDELSRLRMVVDNNKLDTENMEHIGNEQARIMTEITYVESPSKEYLESLGCTLRRGTARDANGKAIAWNYYTKKAKGQNVLEWHWDIDVSTGKYKPCFRVKAEMADHE